MTACLRRIYLIRALYRTVPNTRGQIRADRQGRRDHEDGGRRVLRHRDVRKHGQRVRITHLIYGLRVGPLPVIVAEFFFSSFIKSDRGVAPGAIAVAVGSNDPQAAHTVALPIGRVFLPSSPRGAATNTHSIRRTNERHHSTTRSVQEPPWPPLAFTSAICFWGLVFLGVSL